MDLFFKQAACSHKTLDQKCGNNVSGFNVSDVALTESI